MKTCNKCNINKDLTAFSIDNTKIDKLRTICRLCSSEQKKEKALNRIPINQITVTSKICSRCQIQKGSSGFNRNKSSNDGLFHKCKECRKGYSKLHYSINKVQKIVQSRTYYQNNKDSQRVTRRKYRRRKEVTDILYKLARRLRNRLYYALKRTSWKKGVKFNEYIGCSLEELKMHLEKQFLVGMTWENYGTWHIDHIIPLSSAETEEQTYQLCHFSNLQPLWAKDNILKGNKTA